MRTITFLIMLLLAGNCYSQVVTTQNAVAVTNLKNVKQYGDVLLAKEAPSIEFIPVGIIKVDSEAAIIIVSVSDIERNNVPCSVIADKLYMVSTPGKLWVRVTCTDFEKRIHTEDEVTIVVGPPTPPKPPTPPTPVVPPDTFNNIGQRVAAWSAGLPLNAAVGKVYLDGANNLRTNKNLTIDEASGVVSTALVSLPGYSAYSVFTNGLNTDVKTRWPMAKGVLADYWTCVALGFGVKQ
jgi:hypothetical protein